MSQASSGPSTAEAEDRYRTVAAGFLARVDGIPADAWSAPSPCVGWSVRDVVAHAVIVHRRVLARLTGGELPSIEPPPPQPGEDLRADLRARVAEVREAVADPLRASRRVESMIGELTFAGLVGTLLCVDTLIHTWDVARATGQDERLDQAAVADALAFLAPRDVELRQPGEFGPRLDPPPGADEQARLIAFSGRAA
jgi:uncharacterized protein (TIGR03086 family)